MQSPGPATQINHTNEKAFVYNLSSPLWDLGAANLHDRDGDVEEHWEKGSKQANFGHVHSGKF
jgi:hypothetical protein